MMADDVFTLRQEDELVNILTLMYNNMFTLSEDDVRSQVYEYAKLTGRIQTKIETDVHDGVYICKKVTLKGDQILEEYKFIDKNSRPMYGTGQWVTEFLSRNAGKLSPIYCRSGIHFESPNKQFFDQFTKACDHTEITADRLYNAVEVKVTAEISANQREEEFLAVAEICGSASGTYMPPTLVFPLLNRRLGRMKPKSFYQWFEKFIEFSKPTRKNPVLLLFRGDAPHTKSIKLISKAIENHIVLFGCPLHSSRDMQPLEVSFKPYLSAVWFEVLKKWQVENTNEHLTRNQVLNLFLAAFKKAKETEFKIDGFSESGIYPIDNKCMQKLNLSTSSERNAESQIQMESEVQKKTQNLYAGSLLSKRKLNSRIEENYVLAKLQKTKIVDSIIIDTSEESSAEEDADQGACSSKRAKSGTDDDCEYVSTVQLMMRGDDEMSQEEDAKQDQTACSSKQAESGTDDDCEYVSTVQLVLDDEMSQEEDA